MDTSLRIFHSQYTSPLKLLLSHHFLSELCPPRLSYLQGNRLCTPVHICVVDTNLRQELLLYVFFPDFGPILTSFNNNTLYSLCAFMLYSKKFVSELGIIDRSAANFLSQLGLGFNKIKMSVLPNID